MIEDWDERAVRTMRELLDAYDRDDGALPSILIYIEELILEYDEERNRAN